jgi:hypothetical protein
MVDKTGRFTLSIALGIVLMSCRDGASSDAPPRLRPYELLDVMHMFQTYADKLYFAGRARNWELAGWYRWKLEAAALPVVDGEVEPYRTERYDAQSAMKSMLIPALQPLEQAIEKQSEAAFEQAYLALIGTCNACHALTEHPFVKIIVPTSPIFSNQNYEP